MPFCCGFRSPTGSWDPPHLRATRRSARRYRFDSREADPVTLLDLPKHLPCQVMVSGHPSAPYYATLADWCCKCSSRASGPRSCGSPSRPTGCTGRALPGRTFTNRQRIKRKAANWSRRHAALPPGECLAVLSAIMEGTEDLAAYPEAFAGLGSPPSGTSTVIEDWGRKLLHLALAIVETIAALEQDHA